MMGKQKLLRWIGSIPLVMILLVMIAAPEKTVSASPNLQSTGYVISSSLPYVWLRSQPSSSASVITTIYPGQVFQVNGPSAWDGVQSWAHVFLYSSGLSGWVEMNAIVPANSAQYVPPTTTVGGAAAWNTSTRVVVSSNVPFAYLRASPSSFAAVLSVAPSGTILSIASNSPQWDGTQWWWLVRREGNSATGWVEQVSLQVTSAFRSRVPFPFPFPFPFRARHPRRY